MTMKEKKAGKQIRKRNRQVINFMIVISAALILAVGFNIVQIALKDSGGSGTVIGLDSASSMKNDQYTIGNNPTQFQHDLYGAVSQYILHKKR